MLSFVKTWCEELIVSVIIAVIIEMFVPQGNAKKYVRVVSGIYIIFVILNPIVSNLDNIDIDNWFYDEKYSNSIATSNVEEMSNVYARAIESKIESDFSYVDEARVILTPELEDIERIEITLLEKVYSLDELEKNLIENYGITEDKIYIN